MNKEPATEKKDESKEADSKQDEEAKPEAAADSGEKGKESKEGSTPEEDEKKTEKEAEGDAVEGETNSQVIDRLCKYVYTKGSDRVRTRAMLCHIYNHALHDRLYEARDLMLISHLQGEIQHSDIPTQVSCWALIDSGCTFV